MERLFNLKAGLSKKDDTLPSRILNEPIKSGPSKGEFEDLERMLKQYYVLRWWDENGVPTKNKLKEFGIEDLL